MTTEPPETLTKPEAGALLPPATGYAQFDGETESDLELRVQYGLRLTPCKMPEGTDENKEQALELLSRYVTEDGRVNPQTFGADCIAFGVMLGKAQAHNNRTERQPPGCARDGAKTI